MPDDRRQVIETYPPSPHDDIGVERHDDMAAVLTTTSVSISSTRDPYGIARATVRAHF